ncbi:exonuclease domain-containing protein [Roseivirga sp. BDSF3-8]|uniref:exonuclease domain-containing protein n=1 Tax=Roseivirga sp. BDSF3-8 TaxID=3241598 RepID=UPI003532143A
MYAVVDLETTGGSCRHDKITEVAIYITDGKKIVKSWSSLVNPGCPIPAHITRITGIDNHMVADAPAFHEVAKTIVELLEGRVFVAHNVNFDYGFLRESFAALGFPFDKERLCTVQASRRILPGHRSYSLGKLCHALKIPLYNRHRAAGDAEATALLLHHLVSNSSHNLLSDYTKGGKRKKTTARKLLTDLPEATLRKLPSTTGVYQLKDENGVILYIGKSTDMRQRVLTHLAGKGGRKAAAMARMVKQIDTLETGSELVALLHESDLIKKHKPFYNVMQKRGEFAIGLAVDVRIDGYIRMELKRLKGNEQVVAAFATEAKAKKMLTALVQEHNLCMNLCGLEKTKGPCFHHTLGWCLGACCDKEKPDTYNARAEEALRAFMIPAEDMYIVDEGRSARERAIIRIENGRCTGYGFADAGKLDHLSYLAGIDMQPVTDCRYVRRVINSFLREEKVERTILFKSDQISIST